MSFSETRIGVITFSTRLRTTEGRSVAELALKWILQFSTHTELAWEFSTFKKRKEAQDNIKKYQNK